MKPNVSVFTVNFHCSAGFPEVPINLRVQDRVPLPGVLPRRGIVLMRFDLKSFVKLEYIVVHPNICPTRDMDTFS